MLLHHSEGKSFTIARILQRVLKICQTSAVSWFLVVILVRDERRSSNTYLLVTQCAEGAATDVFVSIMCLVESFLPII